MSNWKKFIELFCNNTGYIENTSGDLKPEYNIYPDSVNSIEEISCFVALDGEKKVLIVTGGTRFSSFVGEETNVSGITVKVCDLSVENSLVLRSIFAFTNPVSAKGHDVSIGLGDRLGLASAGHIKLIRDMDVFPILAQQSIRELNLTDRTYEDVLASAVWAVFQEGYKKGFGADGDHLKTADEVNMALDIGYTMITLDCSEHIDNSIDKLSGALLADKYKELKEQDRTYWEEKYLEKKFDLSDCKKVYIDKSEFMKTVLTYANAISYAQQIYTDLIKDFEREIDFEISIDETENATSVQAHFIIAKEFSDRGVVMLNMAPRFCGEFQKGIDYRGKIDQFKSEF